MFMSSYKPTTTRKNCLQKFEIFKRVMGIADPKKAWKQNYKHTQSIINDPDHWGGYIFLNIIFFPSFRVDDIKCRLWIVPNKVADRWLQPAKCSFTSSFSLLEGCVIFSSSPEERYTTQVSAHLFSLGSKKSDGGQHAFKMTKMSVQVKKKN